MHLLASLQHYLKLNEYPLRFLFVICFTALLSFQLSAQIEFSESNFVDLRMYIDTSSYSWEEDRIRHRGKDYLPFEYQEEQEVAEVYLYFDRGEGIQEIELMPSSDFEIQDSIFIIDDHATMKVKFRELTNANFLKFSFKVRKRDSAVSYVNLPLFPYTYTYVKYYAPDEQLYIGEEKVTEITTNRPDNIVIDNRWTEHQPINYQMRKDGSRILLNLEPTQLGTQSIRVPISVKKPYVKDGVVRYDLPSIEQSFSIKTGRLAFLQMDEQEITPNDDKTEPVVIQMESSRLLLMGKTYRVENQEEPGGALVAELFTKNRLNNDKVLCLLRPYAHHRKSDGYLYVKDGDSPRFVTNVDITPKSQIKDIYLQREGEDWEKSNVVYPGESLSVRIEGVALHKSQFSFPGIENLQLDSLIRNESIAVFKIKVPIDISATKIEIFDRSNNTNKYLEVKEFQRPRPFDFINLELGHEEHTVSEVDRPIYYEGNLTDLVISFDRSKIDQNRDINGKQYINIKVKVSNKDGNLIELYEIDEVVVCPNEKSIRSAHYKDPNCVSNGINLNNYLSKKTYDMDEWSRIELQISHVKDKYQEKTESKKIQIYLKRKYNFDIDVSFPGGLLILKAKERDFSNFSGVSFAMIAQFSFYQPGKIAKYQPYKVGAGFIAIDAFNFSESASNRDVGLVVIGSLYPSSGANRKLTFPLYAGFGYLMKERKFFSLIGPGIRVRF
ncbi:hypothetical protein [Marinoscillum sp. MHG1-6]|uniref:hypothetical protein n=1 Tax=Marinoscillum sp. MHG1-6 TaxID=2959627 RepID=UPI00215840DA|nr:hypothetical protein [Marinoscillum sp. MHG1-6]